MILILLLTSSAYSDELLTKRFGFDIGTGLKSNQGSLALGLRYFPTQRFDFHLNRAMEKIGPTSTIGSRIYTDVTSETCMFIFDCQSRYYLGAQFGHSDGGILSYNDNDLESDYQINESNFVSMNIGFFDIFKDRYVYSADISYRTFIAEPTSKVRKGEGADAAEDIISTYFQSGLGIGLNFGYLF